MIDVWHRDLFHLMRLVRNEITVIGGTGSVVANENPDRVVLMIAAQGGTFSLDVAQTSSFFFGLGQGSFGGGNTVVITQSTHGLLCQLQWQLRASALDIFVTVWEVILDRQPNQDRIDYPGCRPLNQEVR